MREYLELRKTFRYVHRVVFIPQNGTGAKVLGEYDNRAKAMMFASAFSKNPMYTAGTVVARVVKGKKND